MNIYIEVSGNYTLNADALLQQKDVEEVRLLCDTSSAPVNITLFAISDLNRVVNQKIFVIDETGNASVNNITVIAGGTDTINEAANVVINTDNGRIALYTFTLEKWGAFVSSTSSGLSPFENKYVYVDDTFGNDATAIPYRIDKPFKTIAAAEAAADPTGDTLYIFPGTYTEGGLGIDRLKYYFAEGTTLQSPSTCFNDAAGAIRISIAGYCIFSSDTGTPFEFLNGSQIELQGTSITGVDMAINLGSTIFGNTKAIVSMFKDIVSSGNGIIVNGSATECYVTCKSIQSPSSTTAVVGDATTKLHINCDSIVTSGSAGDSFAVHNVGGEMIINCNNVIKQNAAAGIGAAVQIHPAAAAGSVLILRSNIQVPLLGIAYNLTNGNAQIYGNVTGGGRCIITGSDGTTIHKHYGNIESNTEGQAAITMSGGNMYYSGRIEHLSNTPGAHGVTKTAGTFIIASNTVIVCTNGGVDSITGTAGQTYLSYPGCVANRAANAGIVELVGTISVSPFVQ